MDEQELHRHILYKIELALRGRSWNWLAQKSGISQSTLQTQKGTPDRPGPRFSLETLLAVGGALGKPVEWFLPGQVADDAEETEKDVALIAYREMTRILNWSEALMQGEVEKARGLAREVGPILSRALATESDPTLPRQSSEIRQSDEAPEALPGEPEGPRRECGDK